MTRNHLGCAPSGRGVAMAIALALEPAAETAGVLPGGGKIAAARALTAENR